GLARMPVGGWPASTVVEVLDEERQLTLAGHGEAATADVVGERRVAAALLVVPDLGRPEQVEVLLETKGTAGRRHGDGPEDVHRHRAERRIHAGPDEDWTDLELGVRFGREEDLSPGRRRSDRGRRHEEHEWRNGGAGARDEQARGSGVSVDGVLRGHPASGGHPASAGRTSRASTSIVSRIAG